MYNKYCPVGKCKALTQFVIDEALCKGCMACAKKCPVSAITGEKGKVHSIDRKLCTKCGACVDTCKFEAIKGERP